MKKEEFLLLITENNLKEVTKALKEGVDRDAIGAALVLAAEKNYYNTAQLLLLHKPKAKKSVHFDNSPPVTAHFEKDKSYAGLFQVNPKTKSEHTLQVQNPNPTKPGSHQVKDQTVNHVEGGKTALHWALENNNLDLFKLLVEKGARSDIGSESEPSVSRKILQEEEGRYQEFRQALKNAGVTTGEDPQTQKEKDEEEAELVKDIQNSEAKDFEFDDGDTYLHYAASKDYSLLIGTLLEHHELDPSTLNNAGNTALYVALQYHSYEFAKNLLKADSKAMDEKSLEVINKNSKLPEIKDLLTVYHQKLMEEKINSEGFDPSAANPNGDTLLHIAVQCDLPGIVSQLLKDGNTNPALRNKNGDTALHIAVKADNLEIAQALIQADKEAMGVRNSDKKTPVDLMAKKEIFKDLLSEHNSTKKTALGHFSLRRQGGGGSATPKAAESEEPQTSPSLIDKIVRKLHVGTKKEKGTQI